MRRVLFSSCMYISSLITGADANAVCHKSFPFLFAQCSPEEASLLSVRFGVGCKAKRSKNPVKGTSTKVAENCGEDAYYITETESYLGFGVADGVGGWTESGVDPSKFSHSLVTESKSFTEGSNTVFPSPLSTLETAYKLTLERGDENPGGSTACFLTMNRMTGFLESANLGDSGYLIIRKGQIIHRSAEQTYGFNTPYQLALYPSWIPPNRGSILNKPSDADITDHQVLAGDIIFVGSDGLFDNVFDGEIVEDTKRFMDRFYEKHPKFVSELQNLTQSNDPKRAQLLSEIGQIMTDLSFSLTMMANSFAHDNKRVSPFAKSAQSYGYRFSGGKVDDTTVLVGYVHL